MKNLKNGRGIGIVLLSGIAAYGGCALSDYTPPTFENTGGSGQGGGGGTAGEGGMGGMGQGGGGGCVDGAMAECYTGQANTKGVGVCKAGLASCNGGVPGECMGEVVPQLESCTSKNTDTNCDGVSGCAGTPVKASTAGGSQDDAVFAMATDKAVAEGTDGSSYAVGVKGGVMPSQGYPTSGSVLLVKRGPAGAISDFSDMFVPALGGFAYGLGVSVLPTDIGEIALLGAFVGTKLSIASTEIIGNAMRSGFLSLFKQNGDLLWAKPLTGTPGAGADASVDVRSVAAGADGTIYVSGGFAGAVDFGGITKTSGDSSDGFAAAFSNNGTAKWCMSVSGPGEQSVHGIAMSPNGRLYIAVQFTSEANLVFDAGPQKYPAAVGAGTEILLAEISPSSGSGKWGTPMGGIGEQTVRALAASDEKVVAVGGFRGTMSFPNNTVTSLDAPPLWDGFLVALDSNGMEIGDRVWQAPGNQIGTAVTIDSFGDMVVAGNFSGSLPAGAATNPKSTSVLDTNAFVAKFLSADVIPWKSASWAFGFGDGQPQYASSVLVTPARGHILVGGFSQGALTGVPNAPVNMGVFDAFIVETTN